MNGATWRSWGGQSVTPSRVITPASPDAAQCPAGSYLPVGAGRSYGDSCLPAKGALIATRGLKAVVSFDQETGRLKAEAGLLLADVLSLVIPQGWFLPVTPGTRWVTLGGALANDVHGKNHHRRGSFGEHILAFELVRSDGARMVCSRSDNADMFVATIGGMGLTGLVTWLEIQLLKVPSPWLAQETTAFESLEEFTSLDSQAAQSHEYTVAWVDALAKGSRLGRGVFMKANHADCETATSPDRGALVGVPFMPPARIVPALAIAALNPVYRWNALRKPRAVLDYRPFFYPLDAIDGWNRLYGPRGLRQFQCVVPVKNAAAAMSAMIETAQARRQPSWLAVVKRFGDQKPEGLMSFARPGYTIALDFPHRGVKTDALFTALQKLAMDAGGAINPYKDSSMTPDAFRQSFPQWQVFEDFIDPAAASMFSQRMGLKASNRAASSTHQEVIA